MYLMTNYSKSLLWQPSDCIRTCGFIWILFSVNTGKLEKRSNEWDQNNQHISQSNVTLSFFKHIVRKTNKQTNNNYLRLCALAAVQCKMLRGHVDSCICCRRKDHGSMRRLLLSIQQTSSPPAAAQQVSSLGGRHHSLGRASLSWALIFSSSYHGGSSWLSGSFQLSTFI